MNTQTAGVTVKDLKSFAGKLWEEQDIDDPGQVIYNLLSMIDKLPDESIPTITIQQALEVWEDACKDLLKDIAQIFLDKSNHAKADTLRDAEVFQAVGETIENFPLRDKRTYFLNKFGIDIDKK